MTNESDPVTTALRNKGWVEVQPGLWEKPKARPESARQVAVVERSPRAEPLAKTPAQTQAQGRFRVVITSVRNRLIDPDNLCPKYHIDLCRRAGLIPDDSAKFVHLHVQQRKVEAGESEHTEIVIEKL